MPPENWISWIILGLIAGLLARKITPGENPSGCLVTIVLGIVGSFIGGWVGHQLGFNPTQNPGSGMPSLGSIATATGGAILLLGTARWLKK